MTDKNKAKWLYRGLQGCYWMMYSASFGYLTYLLTELGFSTSAVGAVTAGFGAVGTIIQPALGRYADIPKIGWKKILRIMIILMAASAAGQLTIKVNIVCGIFAGFGILLEGAMIPLVNQACFACTQEGDEPDYGTARGTGSLTYAIVSVSLGQLTKGLGPVVIPVVQLVICALMLLDASLLPCIMHEAGSGEETSSVSIIGFFRKYPGFLKMFFACLLLMLFHTTTTTYMLQIVRARGGDTDTMGIALAVSAVAEIPVMFTFGRIIKKFSIHSLLVVASVFFIVKGLLYLFSPNIFGIYVSQVFQILSFAIYANATVYYAQERVAKEDETKSQACMTVPQCAGTVIGSLAGGVVLSYGDVYDLCAGCLVLAVLGTIIMAVPEKKNKNVMS